MYRFHRNLFLALLVEINGYQCHTNEDQDVLSDIEKLLMDRMKTLEELKISAAEQNL